ncbi:MAG: non-canonical purine NTP diphosphatase [Prevotella sp.]|nr:non-canonical purine NTP diphosphatase [Prevotella sp.]
MKTKVKGQKPIVVFATNNAHKLEEVRQILGDRFEIRSLKEIGCMDELPETHDTLEENAIEKARYITKFYGFDCFADDTGLEVDALNGLPGVYSARYANIDDADYDDPDFDKSHDHDSEANMRKLLAKLEGETNRKAQFRTVVALVYKGQEYRFEGIVKGDISTEKHGTEGFGYDPVFVPEGYSESFAELGADVKNKISHRALAVEKLVTFLKEQK